MNILSKVGKTLFSVSCLGSVGYAYQGFKEEGKNPVGFVAQKAIMGATNMLIDMTGLKLKVSSEGDSAQDAKNSQDTVKKVESIAQSQKELAQTVLSASQNLVKDAREAALDAKQERLEAKEDRLERRSPVFRVAFGSILGLMGVVGMKTSLSAGITSILSVGSIPLAISGVAVGFAISQFGSAAADENIAKKKK